MKSFSKLFSLCLFAVVSSAQAGQELMPIPESPMMMAEQPVYEQGGVFVESCAEPLYTNVKYKDLREMSPCAQPKIIAVKDPCDLLRPEVRLHSDLRSDLRLRIDQLQAKWRSHSLRLRQVCG